MSEFKDLIRKKIGKKTSIPNQATTPRIIVKKIEVSDEIKRLFLRIHKNLDKAWGLDNNYQNRKEKKHNIPKYRNLWEDWDTFKGWFERVVMEPK